MILYFINVSSLTQTIAIVRLEYENYRVLIKYCVFSKILK